MTGIDGEEMLAAMDRIDREIEAQRAAEDRVVDRIDGSPVVSDQVALLVVIARRLGRIERSLG